MPSTTPHSIEFDRSRWPLCITRFHGRSEAKDVIGHLAKLESLLTSRLRYVNLVDMRLGEASSKEIRFIYADWFKKHQKSIERLCLGSAIVVPSHMRAALSAVMWLHPIPGPFAIFSDLAAAETWLRQQLRGANMAFPPPPSDSYVASTTL